MPERAMRDEPRRSPPRGGLSTRNITAMLLLAVMWGLSVPAMKLGLQDLPPLTLTALRFLVAIPLLMILALGDLRVPLRALPA